MSSSGLLSDVSGQPFQVGDVCDRYEIVAPLAAGGVGVVYEARHQFTGGKVALKALNSRASDQHERMKREARALAEIHHRYVVRVFDGGVTDAGVVWFAMEFLSGQTLRSEVYRSQGLPLERALRFGVQIAEGVHAAHSRGVIHRDLKPENVFVIQPADEVRVLDFGTSKFTRTSGNAQTTDRMRIMGTQAYMPPERLLGNVVDFRSDIYSLGHILYEMVSGVHCFSEGAGPLDLPGVYELGIRQIHVEPIPLTERRPGTPEVVSRIVQRALAKKPSARQQSMLELVDELTAARTELAAMFEAQRKRPSRPPPFEVAEPSRRALVGALVVERADPPSVEVPTTVDTSAPFLTHTQPLDASAFVSTGAVAAVAPVPTTVSVNHELRTKTERVPGLEISDTSALVLLGAVRFASARPELSQCEQAVACLGHEDNGIGLLQHLCVAFVREPNTSQEWARAALIARALGVAEERRLAAPLLEAICSTVATASPQGVWEIEPRGKSQIELFLEILAGAAFLLPIEQQHASAVRTLQMLATVTEPMRDFTLDVLGRFWSFDWDEQVACRDALIRLFTGNVSERRAAYERIDRILKGPANAVSRPSLETSETPATMSTPARALAHSVMPSASDARATIRRLNVPVVAAASALVCLVLAGGVALIRREAPPVTSPATVQRTQEAARPAAPPDRKPAPPPAPQKPAAEVNAVTTPPKPVQTAEPIAKEPPPLPKSAASSSAPVRQSPAPVAAPRQVKPAASTNVRPKPKRRLKDVLPASGI